MGFFTSLDDFHIFRYWTIQGGLSNCIVGKPMTQWLGGKLGTTDYNGPQLGRNLLRAMKQSINTQSLYKSVVSSQVGDKSNCLYFLDV